MRKLKPFPSSSRRSYPVKERKLSLAKIIGLPCAFASVNTIGIRVVSAATTNGPSALRKPSIVPSATFCSSDLLATAVIRPSYPRVGKARQRPRWQENARPVHSELGQRSVGDDARQNLVL